MDCWRDPRLGEPREVRLPSGTVRYHDQGRGPVIVFLHGYLVNANLWRKVVPLLADRFRCLAPDLPLGSHTVPVNRDADLSPVGIAKLVAELLDELDLRDVTLFGNDSGGAYGQLVAAAHPRRLGRLVLSSCETPEDTWPPEIRLDGRKAIGAVSASYVREAARHLVESFADPVRLVWAADDLVFPIEHAIRYAGDLGAELHTVADSYTYVTEDQPEAAAELIAACARE